MSMKSRVLHEVTLYLHKLQTHCVNENTLRYTGVKDGHQFTIDCHTEYPDQIVQLTILPHEHTPCERSVLFVWTTRQSQRMLERMLQRFFPTNYQESL